MKASGQMNDPITDRAWRLEDSGLDCVALPSSMFQAEALRLKLNTEESDGGGLPFAASPKNARPAESAVTATDVLTYESAGGSWAIPRTDADWLLKALKGYLAGVKLFDAETESEHVENLRRALESTGGVAAAVHPVSVILATRC